MALSPLPVSFPSLSVRKDDYGDQKNIFKSVSGIVNAAQQAVQTIASNVNQSLYALATMLASASAPTAASTGFQNTKGVFWHDTGTNTIWLRDQADSAWIEIGTVDETGKAFNPANAVPSGSVIPFAGSTAPSGWIICDGSAISRTTFATLFALIGTTYGAGNGSTTFNIPDLRGRLVAGFDSANATGRLTSSATGGVSASALGNAGGEQAHSLSSTELASHNHSVSGNTGGESVSHTHSVSVPGTTGGGASTIAQVLAGTNTAPFSASVGSNNNDHTHSFNVTSGSAGSGSAHNNVQPTLIMNYIIKS